MSCKVDLLLAFFITIKFPFLLLQLLGLPVPLDKEKEVMKFMLEKLLEIGWQPPVPITAEDHEEVVKIMLKMWEEK